MPYKSDSIKLNEKQDRRKKLTEWDKNNIREIYFTGLYGCGSIAKMYDVSKSTIQIIVNPEIAKRHHEYAKNNWRKYCPDNEKRNEIMTEHRHYKHALYVKGELS